MACLSFSNARGAPPPRGTYAEPHGTRRGWPQALSHARGAHPRQPLTRPSNLLGTTLSPIEALSKGRRPGFRADEKIAPDVVRTSRSARPALQRFFTGS